MLLLARKFTGENAENQPRTSDALNARGKMRGRTRSPLINIFGTPYRMKL
jgi:hypothetical protein